MFAYECVLAAALLTSPGDTEPVGWSAPFCDCMHAAFMQAALDLELVDSREEFLLQGQSRDSAGDFKEVRCRFVQLLRAPLLAEGERFPDRRLINELLGSNRSYRRELETRLTLDFVHAEELRLGIRETDQLHYAWNLLRDARCDYYYVTVRRQALAQLRDLLGDEAYYRTLMPPHVPLWHFPAWR
jgi:hypothetical protein